MFTKKESSDEEDFYFIYPQEENPDWDHARNRSFALKRVQGCWSSSLFSVKVGDLLTPNRDHPTQGVMCLVDGEYNKFLDSFMFKLERGKETIELEPTKAKVSPWGAIYFYENEDVTLKVWHYLVENEWKKKLGGWVKFEVETKKYNKLNLTVSPLVDIRKIFNDSPDISDYRTGEDLDIVKISRGDRELKIGTVEGWEAGNDTIEWNYKLGHGNRNVEEGVVKFEGVRKKPFIPGKFRFEIIPGAEHKIGFVCGKEVDDMDVEDVMSEEVKDLKEAIELVERFPLAKGSLKERFLKVRIASLNKFGVLENETLVPEAGEWWFKQVWFGDLFESIYNNMEFYRKAKGDEWLKRVFKWARMFIKMGTMANSASKKDLYHNSLDGTMLYMLSMAKFYEKTEDEEFREKMKKEYGTVIKNLGEGGELIKSRADSSWIDSKWDGRPTRIPDSWDVKDDRNFLLPEINAMWIKVLEKYNSIFGGNVKIKKIWGKWRETFWNEEKEFPYQIVYRKGDKEFKDTTESSVGVVSMSILNDHFRKDEMMAAWSLIKDKLLVERKPVFFEKRKMPFGIIVKNTEKRVYLNDEQYHEATVWPRDVPYLCDILKRLGKDSMIEDIWTNILDHQMSEGAVFYNNELFSLPEGGNTAEMALSENPVPMKNPAQLWSHTLPETTKMMR